MPFLSQVNPEPTATLFKPYNLSLGTRAGDFLLVTGQVGLNDDGSFPDDLETEIANVFRHLDRVLATPMRRGTTSFRCVVSTSTRRWRSKPR